MPHAERVQKSGLFKT